MENVGKALLNSLIDVEELYQNAPCGYCSLLPDGTIIKINRTLINWLGYSEEQIIGRMKLTDLLSKGGKIYYEMFYFPLLKLQGYVNEINFDIICKVGNSFPGLLNANTLKDEEGNILAINVVVNDITDRKKYEVELLNAMRLAEAEKNQFEFVSDYIPEMIWAATPEGEINYVNKRFRENFGEAELITRKSGLISSIHPEDRLPSLRGWLIGIRSRLYFQIELRLKNETGQYNWYLVKGIPYKENESIVKWMGSCLNISRHVLEMERKDEFISIASHELKTPITSLKLSIDLLSRFRDAKHNEMQNKLLEQSTRNLGRITELIDDLLNVHRMKIGQLPLNKLTFLIGPMLRNCCNPFMVDGQCSFSFSGDDSIEVYADEGRIEQVVVNLINNAIKYAPDSKHIALLIERTGSSARVSITDKGPGIAKEKIPHLFERYYRADHTGAKYSGLGLGLYICKEIINRHGGEIGVNSEIGKGSSFWFTLPKV